MIVLDTTVLAYAVGAQHPLRDPCRRLLQAHADGRIEATTTVEGVQEFAHIRARRQGREDAGRLARRYAAAFDLLVTTPEDLDRGLGLFETYPALGAFDAVLAAAAMNRGAEALISADRAFATIPDLRFIDPATDALSQLIGPVVRR
ncbi:MAG: PIN domain-containing protein [Chloroflexota bacterium]|nr:PIN domain-containing protein [Chloroflexota bacterium]